LATLIINAPWHKKDSKGNPIGHAGRSRSWETFFEKGIGLGYILYPREEAVLRPGFSTVVLLRTSKNHERRAEARLTELKRTPRQAKNGQRRYDIFFEDQKEVNPYVYLPKEKLKRNGVKVII